MRGQWWIAAACAAGCVTQGTFDQLKADYDKLASEKAALEERSAKEHEAYDQERQTLEQAIAACKQRAEELTAAKTALEARVAEIETKHAEVLKKGAKLSSSVEEMRAALVELEKRKAESEARLASYREMLARFKPLIDSGKLKVRIKDGRMLVELATDILFKSGSARLSPEGEQAVKEVTAVLLSLPERRYEVAGHTDNVPIPNGSNWRLGFERAHRVLETMVEAGMPNERVMAASYGEFRPVGSNDDNAGKALNRRIEIVIVPDLNTLPGMEDLKRLEG
jgi:chemotaxis protein MotB